MAASHILSVVADRDIVTRELLTPFMGNVLRSPVAHPVVLSLHPSNYVSDLAMPGEGAAEAILRGGLCTSRGR